MLTDSYAVHSVRKKHPEHYIDCHSKTGLLILIIFGMNISGTTGHFTTSPKWWPNVCFCTTWRKL